MTFAQRPLLTSPEQLDSWQPDVAIVGAPFDLGTTNRPGRPLRPAGTAQQRLRIGHVSPQLRLGDLRPRRSRRLRRRPLPARHGGAEPRQHQEPRARDRQPQDHPVHDGRRPHRHLAGRNCRRRCLRLRQRRHGALRRPRRHGRHHRRQPGQSWHADAPADRERSDPRSQLHPDRSAQLLAAAGCLGVDGRAGHALASDGRDLGARIPGRDGRRGRRGARRSRAALHLHRHRFARPGVRTGDGNTRARRPRRRRPDAHGPQAGVRAPRGRHGRRRGRPRLRPRRLHRQRRQPAVHGMPRRPRRQTTRCSRHRPGLPAR